MLVPGQGFWRGCWTPPVDPPPADAFAGTTDTPRTIHAMGLDLEWPGIDYTKGVG